MSTEEFLKAAWRRLQYRPWCFPAREFEKKTGMHGISGKWRMPAGLTKAEIGMNWLERINRSCIEGLIKYYGRTELTFLFRKIVNGTLEGENWHDELRNQLEEIIALNPELQTVKYDKNNIWEAYDFIMGITSGLNRDDIEFYLHRDKNSALKNYSEEQELILETGTEMYWVTSPATRHKIRDFLRTKKESLLKPEPVA